MVTVLAPSATSISSPSPSRSMHSSIVPVPSSTHPTRRPFRPFNASEILPSLQLVNPRHRLIAIFVLGSCKKQSISGCRAFILEPYISVLPQFQCGLHQIFTSRAFYVSQVFISYIVITGHCYKALFCNAINECKARYGNICTDFLSCEAGK